MDRRDISEYTASGAEITVATSGIQLHFSMRENSIMPSNGLLPGRDREWEGITVKEYVKEYFKKCSKESHDVVDSE